MTLETSALYQGDCIKQLRKVEPGSIDLAFADPPFNIGYKYDVYKDKKSYTEYLDWTRDWMTGVSTALKPTGTFWIAIGDDYAAEIKMIAQRDLGLSCRSWVIWYYTFGVNCKRKFTRSHTHLFHFVKDHRKFTFNEDDPAIRVPSARQLVYADKRGNPDGRLPDDTWILRPQDIPDNFKPNEDTWFFPRVSGTFKQRAGFHGCQMPEQLLGRIIMACSKPGETVLDPFAGSGTTLAVAKKLKRDWIGFELSKEYVKQIKKRLKEITPGDPLEGAKNPLLSAPSTANGKQRGKKGKKKRVAKSVKNSATVAKRTKKVPESNGRASHKPNGDYDHGLIDAFKASHDGFSADWVIADPDLDAVFCDACSKIGLPDSPKQWNWRLLGLRKAGKLPRFDLRKQKSLSAQEMDPYLFASEIAMRKLGAEIKFSLDVILCDPELAVKFDEIAKKYSPGFSSFEYRWAALRIRKKRKAIHNNARSLWKDFARLRLPPRRDWCESTIENARSQKGIYVIWSKAGDTLYIGETFNLAKRVSIHNGNLRYLGPDKLSMLTFDESKDAERLAFQSYLISKRKTLLNFEQMAISDVVPV